MELFVGELANHGALLSLRWVAWMLAKQFLRNEEWISGLEDEKRLD